MPADPAAPPLPPMLLAAAVILPLSLRLVDAVAVPPVPVGEKELMNATGAAVAAGGSAGSVKRCLAGLREGEIGDGIAAGAAGSGGDRATVAAVRALDEGE